MKTDGYSRRVVMLLVFSGTMCGIGCSSGPGQDDGRVSEFGKYEGYSEERFDEWLTTSEYVEMRDGVRLAVEVTRPAVNGVAVDGPLPVVWTHSRYHRNPGAMVKLMAEDLYGRIDYHLISLLFENYGEAEENPADGDNPERAPPAEQN